MSNYLKAKKYYLEAAKIIYAQNVQADQELESPNIKIEPQESLIQKAVEEIKKIDPNYFKGVRSIVSGTMSGYGEVRSGPDKDPAVINLNFQRIKTEVNNSIKQQSPNASQEDIDKAIVKAIVNSIIEVVAHEKGHIRGYDSEKGFAPESEAEREAQTMMGKINI